MGCYIRSPFRSDMKHTLAKVFILFLSFNALEAQESNRSLRATTDSLLELSSHSPLENIYLYTNKEVYEAGEDLWFGAMALHRQYLLISDLSKTLYVELRSADEDLSIASEMFGLEQGMLKGHLYLPDTLASGEYWLMAFTANSLKYADERIGAVKKILIKDEIVPHVLIQTEFDQEFLESNDPVKGQIRLLTPGGDPVVNAKTLVTLKKGRKTVGRNRLRSDSTGRMNFNLNHKTEVPQLSLSVKMDHDGHEEAFQRALPYDKRKRVQLQFMPEGGNLLAGLSNDVAFKAVDESGMPFTIEKGTLYANGEALTEFESAHDGMGKFGVFAVPDVSYTVRIEAPAVDSTFQLPVVQVSGIQLNLHKQTNDYLTFGVIQTAGLKMDSVHLMVKQRGMPFSLASGMMKESGLLFQVPVADLPQGIVEATLFDRDHIPVAERLAFVGLNNQLEITATVNEEFFGVKEKVNLKLSVKDKDGNPVQSVLNLAAVDEVFNSPFAETNMATHFLLTSDIRGNIYEPAYYFDRTNSKAADHLDLLLLTQGWRSYAWQADYLNEESEKEELPLVDHLVGVVNTQTLSRAVKKKSEHNVLILSKSGAMSMSADSAWRFELPGHLLWASVGHKIVFKVPNQSLAKIDLINGFDHTTNNRTVEGLNYPLKATSGEDRNWHKLHKAPAAAKEIIGIEVVDSKKEYGLYGGTFGGIYKGVQGDYVCTYSILNCQNHRFGSPPVPGQRYRYRGRSIVYKGPDAVVAVNSFKAYYKVPTFYQPDYDEKPGERQIPDFRNTLVWESNLLTDENGEAELTFFTSDIRSIFNGRVEALGANGHFGVAKFKLVVLK